MNDQWNDSQFKRVPKYKIGETLYHNGGAMKGLRVGVVVSVFPFGNVRYQLDCGLGIRESLVTNEAGELAKQA